MLSDGCKCSSKCPLTDSFASAHSHPHPSHSFDYGSQGLHRLAAEPREAWGGSCVVDTQAVGAGSVPGQQRPTPPSSGRWWSGTSVREGRGVLPESPLQCGAAAWLSRLPSGLPLLHCADRVTGSIPDPHLCLGRAVSPPGLRAQRAQLSTGQQPLHVPSVPLIAPRGPAKSFLRREPGGLREPGHERCPHTVGAAQSDVLSSPGLRREAMGSLGLWAARQATLGMGTAPVPRTALKDNECSAVRCCLLECNVAPSVRVFLFSPGPPRLSPQSLQAEAASRAPPALRLGAARAGPA